MRIVKIVLSWVALLAGAAGGAIQSGALHLSSAVGDVVMAAGTLLGFLGYSPLVLTPALSSALRTISGLCAAVVLAHAKTVAELPPGEPPPGLGWLFTAIGGLGVVVGIAAYSPIKHEPKPIDRAPPVADPR